MIERKKESVKTAGGETLYTHLTSGSDKVCFMFSGMGYHYEKALFHYSTVGMLEQGFDVVYLHYQYEADFLKGDYEDVVSVMARDIEPVLNRIMGENHYVEIILLAKSLGTIPVVSTVQKRQDMKKAKLVLLTPLLSFPQFMDDLLDSKSEGLLVVGTADFHYDKDKVAAVMERTSLKGLVVDGADHSLEAEELDVVRSLGYLGNVILEVKELAKKSVHAENGL